MKSGMPPAAGLFKFGTLISQGMRKFEQLADQNIYAEEDNPDSDSQ
jgi:hypothetical protein